MASQKNVGHYLMKVCTWPMKVEDGNAQCGHSAIEFVKKDAKKADAVVSHYPASGTDFFHFLFAFAGVSVPSQRSKSIAEDIRGYEGQEPAYVTIELSKAEYQRGVRAAKQTHNRGYLFFNRALNSFWHNLVQTAKHEVANPNLKPNTYDHDGIPVYATADSTMAKHSRQIVPKAGNCADMTHAVLRATLGESLRHQEPRANLTNLYGATHFLGKKFDVSDLGRTHTPDSVHKLAQNSQEQRTVSLQNRHPKKH